MPQCHVATSRVVHHPLQYATGDEFLGNAGERRAQPMPLHFGAGLRVDPGQGLARIDDREQGGVGLHVLTVALCDLQRLLGQEQLVIAPILGVAQQDLAALKIYIADLDRRVPDVVVELPSLAGYDELIEVAL